MQIEELLARLRRASVKYSYRKLAKECDVSHETIRKLLLGKSEPNVTSTICSKLDSGLSKNGF